MRQAILYGAGDLRLDDFQLDPDALGPDEIYVEVEVTALSTGTDLGNYIGRSTEVPGAPDYPRPVGYSNVGRIIKVGSAVRSLRQGQRVFSLKPHMSAFIARHDELIVPVPDGISSEQASLGYLTQLGLTALRQARYEPGENIAIVGLGVIGLCTCGLARALGSKVVAIANSPVRAEAAQRLGVHATFLAQEIQNGAAHLHPALGEAGPDIVILTANAWDAYLLSVEIARYGGRVSILGFPGRGQPPPSFNPLDPKWFYGKQLTLIGAGFAPRVECGPADIRFNVRRNLEYIFDLMAAASLSLETIISHRLPWHRMPEAYELAREHSKCLTAAVFDWRSLHGRGVKRIDSQFD